MSQPEEPSSPIDIFGHLVITRGRDGVLKWLDGIQPYEPPPPSEPALDELKARQRDVDAFRSLPPDVRALFRRLLSDTCTSYLHDVLFGLTELGWDKRCQIIVDGVDVLHDAQERAWNGLYCGAVGFDEDSWNGKFSSYDEHGRRRAAT